ncbi:hypothetical protein HU200_049421 [Digitaria exilis]|uniref:Uncharacterized protein n=1 Tax=Digitaria exilis TaxID=1010633 RepID=A0A835AU28_9POAL|nr:hypothetical protein HU200_049421 [Digitaria exilis]
MRDDHSDRRTRTPAPPQTTVILLFDYYTRPRFGKEMPEIGFCVIAWNIPMIVVVDASSPCREYVTDRVHACWSVRLAKKISDGVSAARSVHRRRWPEEGPFQELRPVGGGSEATAVEAEICVEETRGAAEAEAEAGLSYRQNFDDGLASSGRPPYRRL